MLGNLQVRYCGGENLSHVYLFREQVLTIVGKIKPTPDQVQKLELILGAFADACNYINATVNPKIKNKNRIQAEVYKTVREQFSLSANLAVRAGARVASNRKTAALKKRPVKALTLLSRL